jgi:A nuclease family of the HNH/ENDO VII superfamily with conserved AHH
MSHHQDANFLKKHKKEAGTDGGACLNRHERREENNSCSHIWQAVVRAETDDKSLYKWPTYQPLEGKRFETGARWNKKQTAIFPRGMGITRKGPKPHEWDPGVGGNFKDSRVPYWHNAHHIVPNAVLNGSIQEAGDTAEDRRVVLLIRSGLLGASYNLNYKDNMVILPMGKQVAAAMGLPRHLVGDKPRSGQAKEFRSHADYSAEVKKRVEKVISKYLKNLDVDPKKHLKPPNELAKDQLEKCSSDIRISIVEFGSANGGKPLVDMPAEMFGER